MKNKKSGFTLAEVLITLGIIGVVAAMTIPTLIANTNSAKFKSQFKKTLATLSQAALMGEAQYELDYGSATADCPQPISTADPNINTSICALFNGTLSGMTAYDTMNDLKIPGTDTSYSPQFISDFAGGIGQHGFLLADGSLVGISTTFNNCTLPVGGNITSLPNCIGFIDVNGPTLPNKEVRCSDGTASVASSAGNCFVRNNSTDMGDIFPVVFHDNTVEPLTNAARYVMAQSK